MPFPVDRFARKRVAVIGSGSAGIAALWALNRTYHDVYLYEAADRLGGHTNTVQWKAGKFSTAVDTGFIAFNTATYPNFINFLNRVGVETEPTEMTFGVSRDHGTFEWATTGLRAIFSQKRNLFSPRMWRLLFDIFRFNQFAVDLLSDDDDEPRTTAASMMNHVERELTIGEYLDREGYSEGFRDDYLLPLAGALWSTSPERCAAEFPVVTLVRFLWNHRLLSTSAFQPQWLTLKEGSQSYIDAVVKGFPPNHLHVNSGVRRVSNDDSGRVLVHLENGKTEVFDHVVIATHGDQALSMIGPSATEQERSILSCFQTSQSEVYLHSDTSLLPRRRRAWASWNCTTLSSSSTNTARIDKASLTYNMNILQHIPRNTFGDVLVTLNPLHRPHPSLTRARYFYSHPIYTTSAVRAQRLLRNIQNTRGISYAGAWTKYGFLEDGFSSGLYVAQRHLGARLPFEYKDSTYSRGRTPRFSILDHFLRLIILILQVFVVQVLQRLAGAGKQSVRPVLKGIKPKRLNGKLA